MAFMRIQYFSDIHLEFAELELPPTDADLIIAAGDIGPGEMGLKWLETLGKPVIYVAGNHEFYGQEYFSAVETLRKGAAGGNVYYLERESLVLADYRFLGCTLWTGLNGEEHSERELLPHSINDFRMIKYRQNDLGVMDFVLLHQQSRHWLLNELDKPFEGKTVIVTHHAPTLWSWRDNPGSIKRMAYCNDLKEIFHQYEIAAWFHGHTHAVSDYLCAGARILCNPRGYHPEQLTEGFDPGKILEL